MAGKFESCIADALSAEDATEEEKAALRQAQATYGEAYDQASATLSPDEADRFAAGKVMDELQAAKLRAQQLRAMGVRARRNVLAGIAEFKRSRGYSGVRDLGAGGKPPEGGWVQGGEPPKDGPHAKGGLAARALELLVENKPGLAGGPFASIEGRARAIRGQFDALMADVIERFETKTGFDRPGKATLENLVREAFGEDTGDTAAKGLAQAWAETAERARQMFNAAGGGIPKRDDWGLPQHHDAIRIREEGKAAWVDYIAPLLNREKMTDRVTGLPFTEKRLRGVLSEIYDNIASGGAAKRDPGEFLGKGMLANTRDEARVLVFKDANAWLKYQGAFGAGDPFGIMMGHLEEMSRDIARLQILGPNPDHQWAWLQRFAFNEAQREAAALGSKAPIERATVYLRTATDMMDHFTGAANVPEREWAANLGATTRAYLTGTMLGSAIVSDVPSSPIFGAYARTLTGLSKLGHMDELVRQVATPGGRAYARRSGFILEQATDGLIRGAQDSLRLQTVGAKIDGQGLNAFARRVPAAVMRLQGLTGWTQARKRAFRFEFMGALADRADKSYGQLIDGDAEDQAIVQLLQARGFTDQDWNLIRTAPKWEPRAGARFLRPSDIIAHAGEDLGLRVAEMIELQTRQAVPETSLWTRAKLLGQARPGTLQGEFRRSWAMFRSFTLTSSYLFAEDLALRGQGGLAAAVPSVAAAAGLMLGLTVAGGLSLQLRELAKGNDPRPMGTAAFWGAAAMQGGGLGILGDYFYSSLSRAGKSAATTGWGPAAAFLTDAQDATLGNIIEIAGDLDHGDDLATAMRKAHPGRDVANLARRYTPLASLWWARAGWDRAVIDQLQRMIDPDAERSFAQRARSLQTDYGQGQWWRQGQVAPERAPNLANATATQP